MRPVREGIQDDRSAPADCLAGAIQRDYERRTRARDPLDTLIREVRSFRSAAAQILEQARNPGIASADVRGLVHRVGRLEDAATWQGHHR